MSASHIAYGSVRMEPVFMILAQSCAIAAALCIREHCTVQDLPYSLLKPELEKAGQVVKLDAAKTGILPEIPVEIHGPTAHAR
jgi:hypothetical protein